MTLISAGGVACGERINRPGWLRIAGERIADCGSGQPPGPVDHRLPDALLTPGFVDMHVHGGGGASYTPPADADDTARAAAFHRRHGTTTSLASLVSAAPDTLLAAVHALADATRRDLIAGIHLEGPWLSPRYCGAHDARWLRDPDAAEIDALLTAGDGAVAMVTLAPERCGAVAAIQRFVDAGVVVAVGHTDATYDQVRAAIDAGATVGTHLFNAMRPLHHREPGPVAALLGDSRVTVEMIADGVHVHPALIRQVIAAVGPDRVALVTDATAAAGSGDGSFRLGGLDVDVVGGVTRLRGTSTIAGSTATMDRLFATVARLLGAGTDGADSADRADEALTAAARMSATIPARTLGLDRVGVLQPGFIANLVALNRDLRVAGVMVDGRWLGDDPVRPR